MTTMVGVVIGAIGPVGCRVATIARVSEEAAAPSSRRRLLRRTPALPRESGETLVRALYAEHGHILLGYVTRLTGDRDQAQDIVQETLLRAWRNADTLGARDGSVRGWLLTVARNLVIDAARARRSRPAEVPPAAHDPAEPRDHVEDVSNAIVVADALRTLSPEHRAALVEVYLRGRTANEAADVLGVAPGTVKSRVHYAVRALRSSLGNTAGDEQ
jgi:RNA polymerase sigma-70 factor (ECF subfamily)